MSSTARRRIPLFLVLAVILIAAAGAGGWALSAVLRPAEDPLETTDHTFVTVENGEIGETLRLNTVATWHSKPQGVNQATGIVTDVLVTAGDEVPENTVLYTVDLRPIVIAQGTTPAFRDMALEDSGEDVAQLQTMLASAGFYSGPADGGFGAATATAVKAWQESLDIEPTGTVRKGDIVFVPSLPARVTLDSDLVSRGKPLTGGEEVLRVLPDTPAFELPVTESQAGMIPAGTRVDISSPEGDTWEGVTGERRSDEQTQQVLITVEPAGDDPLCGKVCVQVPVSGETLLESEIVTVPAREGLIVPTAAIVTGAGGGTALIDDAGERIAITVVATARGMSVVEGVDEGTRVRLPGEA